MADEPTDLTTQILRKVQEIQAQQGKTLAEHGRLLSEHGIKLDILARRFDGFTELMQLVAQRVAEIQTGMVETISYSTGADARTRTLRGEVDDLKRRVAAIEERA